MSALLGIEVVATPHGTLFLPGMFPRWADILTRVDRELGETYRFILTQGGWTHDDEDGFPMLLGDPKAAVGPLVFKALSDSMSAATKHATS
jgi:hypothetical protein